MTMLRVLKRPCMDKRYTFFVMRVKSFIDGGHQGLLRKQTITRTDDDLRHQCRNMVLKGRWSHSGFSKEQPQLGLFLFFFFYEE